MNDQPYRVQPDVADLEELDAAEWIHFVHEWREALAAASEEA